ncbi:MAG: glycosyltransferase [Helicobacteraceae bacterium]|nr:glycosyltransferase [Helicobacteraceae bacterium]
MNNNTIVILQKHFVTIGGAEIFALNLLRTYKNFNEFNFIMIVSTINDESMHYIRLNYPEIMNKIVILNSKNNLDFIKKLYIYYKTNKNLFTIVAYGYKELFLLNRVLNIKYYILYHDSVLLEEYGNQKYSYFIKQYANKFLSKELISHTYQKKINFFQNLVFSINYIFMKIIVNDATQVCVLSNFSADEKYLIYGIRSLVLKAAIMKEDLLNKVLEKDNYFLSISRLVEKKNIHKIIYGFHNYINKYGTKYTLKIAGTGPYKEELINLAVELNINQYIEFLGFVDTKLKKELYEKASLFICLDSADFDLTFYEALTAKTKVLCSEMFEVDNYLLNNSYVLKTTLEPIDIATDINKIISLSSNWDIINNYLLENVSFEAYMSNLIGVNHSK